MEARAATEHPPVTDIFHLPNDVDQHARWNIVDKMVEDYLGHQIALLSNCPSLGATHTYLRTPTGAHLQCSVLGPQAAKSFHTRTLATVRVW